MTKFFHTAKSHMSPVRMFGGAAALALIVIATLYAGEAFSVRNNVDEALAWECVAAQVAPAKITEGQSSTLSWEFGQDSGIWVTVDEIPGQKWQGVKGSTTVSPAQAGTYTYTVRAHKQGSSWEPTCTAKLVVEKAPVPCPECTLTASAYELTKGDKATLTWTSKYGKTAELSTFGSVALQGSKEVAPTQTTTYKLKVVGTDGQEKICEVTIKVKDPPPVPCPECTLTASAYEITKGDKATLTWTSKYGKTAELYGIGPVALQGSKEVAPEFTTTYKLKVVGEDGQEKICEVTIKVKEPPVPCPECTLTASASQITEGGEVTLTWTSKHGKTATLNGQTVALSGSMTLKPTLTTTYKLTVTGVDGQTKDCEITITVVKEESWCDMYVTPSTNADRTKSTIKKDQSVTITWNTLNIVSGTISPTIGDAGTRGERSVSPATTTTYTGTFTAKDGDTHICSVEVTVVPEEAPVCTISISRSTVKRGEQVTLTWTSENTSSATFDKGIGSVALSGSTNVTVNEATTYTGTFIGNNGETKICTAGVSIEGGGGKCINCGSTEKKKKEKEEKPEPNIVLSKIVKSTPGVYLSEVPYTGFTAGPVLTMFFWLMVLALSALIAYAITIIRPLERIRFIMSGARTPAAASEPEEERLHFVATSMDAAHARPIFAPRLPQAAPVPVTTPYAGMSAATNDTPELDIEERAHRESILLSPDAMRAIATEVERRAAPGEETLRDIFELAKSRFAREDGWILISKERAAQLLGGAPQQVAQQQEAAPAPAARTEAPIAGPMHDVEVRNSRPAFARTADSAAPAQQGSASTVAQPAAQTAAKAERPATHTSMTEMPAAGEFVRWIVEGDEARVFEAIRTASTKGGTEQFIGTIVRKLDDVYKHRIEGNHNPDKELAQLTATWSNQDIEQVLGILVECIDHSYSNNRIGTKVAIAKLFEHFKNK